jgi:hypothetical protein
VYANLGHEHCFVCAGDAQVATACSTTPSAAAAAGDTREACLALAHVHQEGQSQLSHELHAQGTCSSSSLPRTTSLGRPPQTAPAAALTAGLSVHASSPNLPASLSPVHGQQPLSGEALRRLSESLPQQVQMSASPDAFGESSWHHVGLQLAGMLYSGCSLHVPVLCCTIMHVKYLIQGWLVTPVLPTRYVVIASTRKKPDEGSAHAAILQMTAAKAGK